MQPSANAAVSMIGALPGGDWTTLIGRLAVCERELRQSLQLHTQPHGINDIAFMALLACRKSPEGLAQYAICEATGASASSTSVLIEQLKKRGLVLVERPEKNRRKQTVRLTGAGEQLVDEILIDLASWTARLHERISKDEIRRGNELLGRIAKVVHETPVLRCITNRPKSVNKVANDGASLPTKPAAVSEGNS